MVSKATAAVKTKLYCPQKSVGFVMRERLLEKLETALERPLTLVSAPAGYGKSVMVSDWTSVPPPMIVVLASSASTALDKLAALDCVNMGTIFMLWHRTLRVAFIDSVQQAYAHA